MYTHSKKEKKTQLKAVQNSVVQQKTGGFQLQDNRPSVVSQLASTDVIQKKDKFYWVKKAGSKRYVGSFKSHAAANTWWASNKSSYVGYTFTQGTSATKIR